MSVTLDDFSDDHWGMVSDTMQTGRFTKEPAHDYPELHQYVLCGLNEDGSAGAPEPREAPDREKTEVPRWHGHVGAYGESNEGRNSAGLKLDMHKGSASVKGRAGVTDSGKFNGRVDIGLDF